MPKLPRVKPVKVIAALKRAGFYIDHTTGSHYIFYKDDKLCPISVARHNRDMKLGTLRNILRQAEISPEEFLKLLKK